MPTSSFDVNVDITGWDDVVADIEDTLGLRRFGKAVGESAVEILRTSRIWPVDTGFSKAHFGFDLRGRRVEITNEADYAVHVERRTGAALRALEDNEEELHDLVSAWIEGEFDGLS